MTPCSHQVVDTSSSAASAHQAFSMSTMMTLIKWFYFIYYDVIKLFYNSFILFYFFNNDDNDDRHQQSQGCIFVLICCCTSIKCNVGRVYNNHCTTTIELLLSMLCIMLAGHFSFVRRLQPLAGSDSIWPFVHRSSPVQ